jgi:hypothetical protein
MYLVCDVGQWADWCSKVTNFQVPEFAGNL